MKKYFKVKGRKDEIKITVGYELGGYSWYSGQKNARGYYIYVQPVCRNTDEKYGFTSETSTMFEGHKILLEEVNRQSKKALERANAKADEIMNNFAKSMAMEKGWELEE